MVIDYINSRLESDCESDILLANIDVLELMKSAAPHMISAIAAGHSDTQISVHNKYTQCLDN